MEDDQNDSKKTQDSEQPKDVTTEQAAPEGTPNEGLSLDTQTEPSIDQPVAISSPKKRFKLHRKQAIILAGVVILAATALTLLLLRGQKETPAVTNNTEQTVEEDDEQPPAADDSTPVTIGSKTVLQGNTFLASPKDLGNLNFYKDPENYFGYNDEANTDPRTTSEKFIYRQIGTTKDGRQIIVYTNGVDEFGGVSWFFALGKNDTYQLLEGNSPTIDANSPESDGYYTELQAALSENVSIDRVSMIKEFDFILETRINGQPIRRVNSAIYLDKGKDGLTENNTTMTYLGTTDELEMFRIVSRDEATYQLISLYGVFKNIFGSAYDIKGEVSDAADTEIAITWQKGEQTKAKYYSQGPGCGTGGYILPKNVSSSDLVQVGTTPKGQKVYQLPNTHAFTQYLYNEDYDKSGDFSNDDSLSNLSIETFSDKHAYFLIENSFGEYMAFIRQDMFVRGGCGKPVIYLYPTAQTLVDVAVGADVVISEPLYPSSGWQDVLARPNGTLLYKNKSYNSLYWEGYGHGPYPDMRTVGRVVPQATVRQEIRNDLKKLGLIDQEINDFMEFWEPRLPSNPYIKLSWLNTKQMDELAPLTISPAPQTSIRVFLEFEGLDRKINLTEQKLSSLPRRGFTVVEWGGLLKEGIR